jgi:hypothetical protein
MSGKVGNSRDGPAVSEDTIDDSSGPDGRMTGDGFETGNTMIFRPLCDQ